MTANQNNYWANIIRNKEANTNIAKLQEDVRHNTTEERIKALQAKIKSLSEGDYNREFDRQSRMYAIDAATKLLGSFAKGIGGVL